MIEGRQSPKAESDGLNRQKTKRVRTAVLNDVGADESAIWPTWHAQEQRIEVEVLWCVWSTELGVTVAEEQNAPRLKRMRWMLMRTATKTVVKNPLVALKGNG